MVELLNMISKTSVKVLAFGGFDEIKSCVHLVKNLPTSLITGKLSLEEELAIMETRLHVGHGLIKYAHGLFGRHQGYLHLGRHRSPGRFSAWQQPDEYSLRIPIEELECRPCTIYGKGKCKREDLACMVRLTPDKVYNKLVDFELI